ncbi:hypothetical protein FIBSPDRAFT_850065 [Athelia psychrophila]|uniref:Uncharacterized protein n=1 Tax=Athelia psychrophila TaxID=1759441 RepID=A0A166TWY1_9AGAM|nr:hypothetical protein FIBSPDRAFT_850065 [Fibularhizoctonia sp. CBS 109695]
MRMTCKICRFQSAWIKRPDWITPVRDRQYYFCTTWPVTSEMEEEALGVGEQRLWALPPQVEASADKESDNGPAPKRPRPS